MPETTFTLPLDSSDMARSQLSMGRNESLNPRSLSAALSTSTSKPSGSRPLSMEKGGKSRSKA